MMFFGLCEWFENFVLCQFWRGDVCKSTNIDIVICIKG